MAPQPFIVPAGSAILGVIDPVADRRGEYAVGHDQARVDGRPRAARRDDRVTRRASRPEAPFVIEHREALIYMLCEAAELEHGIMCQYLFAAFSLKQREDEGLTAEELEAVTRWRRVISHVATEEMLHLALVQNLLSAIGAAPHLGRPNLPAPAHHYPAGVNLTLVPFGEPALRHFMFLERPEGMELEGAEGIDAPVHDAVPLMAESDIVPQLQDFATVGSPLPVDRARARSPGREVRRAQPVRRTAARSGDQRRLRLAGARRGDRPRLGAAGDRHDPRAGRGRARSLGARALRPVRADPRRVPAAEGGEPGLRARPTGHVRDGAAAPSTTTPCRGSPTASRRGCTDLFNVGYEVLLQMLERYFAHTEETDAQLATLADAAVALMLRVLKPLGDLSRRSRSGPITRG